RAGSSVLNPAAPPYRHGLRPNLSRGRGATPSIERRCAPGARFSTLPLHHIVMGFAQTSHGVAGRPRPLSGAARRELGSQPCRSTIIFFISAIALAGFRSLGHTSVQFMMV